MDKTDPLFHAAETTEIQMKAGTFLGIIDPRAHYIKGQIDAAGGTWASTHNAYVFSQSDRADFDDIVARIEAMPFIPLPEEAQKNARYADEALFKAGIAAQRKPIYENGPTQKFYVVPSQELLQKAMEIVHTESRAKQDQIEKVRGYITGGRTTLEILGMTPKDFERKVEAKELSQGDVKEILRKLEPAPEQAVADTKRFANEGRLTDSLLKKLASEERIPQTVADAGVTALMEDLNKPSAEQSTVAEIVYAINSGAKRMATADLKAQIVALDNVGVDLGKIDDLDMLFEGQAKSIIRSGKAFVQNESEFAEQTEAVRQNWTVGRRLDSYGKDKTTAAGTAQGAAQRGTDSFLKAMETGAVPGLARDAQEVPWPTRGYAAGKVVFTAGSLTILAQDDGKTFLKADHERVRFNADALPSKHEGEYLAFSISKNGTVWGNATESNSVGAAICELDARQQAQAAGRDYKVAQNAQGSKGTVFAMRGDYATVDLGDSFATVPKVALDTPTATYGSPVSIAGEQPAIEHTATTTRPRGGRGARS